MSSELLVIEHESLAHRPRPSDLLRGQDGFRCERTSWSSVSTEKLLAQKTQLIVAVAFPELAALRGLFHSLKTSQTSVPVLGILPEDTPPDQLFEVWRSLDDFLLWPVRKAELLSRVARLLGDARRPSEESYRRAMSQEAAFRQLVGGSPQFLETLRFVPLMAANEAPVLLSGESGTGKELFAQAIHYLSERRSYPFIPVECGAVPETLIENELFGHTRGAYTGANADQKGLVAAAKGGTLFLDEIDALSLTAQAKLLRFVQEGTYRPLGSEKRAHADVRIIAATNRDLEQQVHSRQFRLDLYFRLNVLHLSLPPLRERSGDIEVLTRHFLATLCSGKTQSKSLSPSALRVLERYHWPGNVRELFSVIQRALVLCDGPQILSYHIKLHTNNPASVRITEDFRTARSRALESFEQTYIESLLVIHHGNVTRAAKAAGKERRAFGRLVKKYGIKRGDS